MKIYVFGNPDLDMDSMPIRLLPELKNIFPNIEFIHLDPNEEIDFPENLIILDTTLGIEKVEIIEDLSLIKKSPAITMHDFDLGSLLLFLLKTGKISNVKIIGIPQGLNQSETLNQLKPIFSNLLLEND